MFPYWSRFSKRVVFFQLGHNFPNECCFSKLVPVFYIGPVFPSESRFSKWVPVFQMGSPFPCGSHFSIWVPFFRKCVLVLSTLILILSRGSRICQSGSWFSSPRFFASLAPGPGLGYGF